MNEEDTARVGEQTVMPPERATAATNQTKDATAPLPRLHRSEKLLRDTLSMLCHFVWHRRTRPGDHMWSIPVDRERDFDCILSDAIDELVELRASSRPASVSPPKVWTQEMLDRAEERGKDIGRVLNPSNQAASVSPQPEEQK